MKRISRIISVCLVIVILTCLMSACGSSKKFVGTWERDGSEEIMVLANDGTGSTSEAGLSGSIVWSVEKDKVFITISACGMTETNEYAYEFSGDTMTLTNADGDELVYRKAK